MDRPDVVQGLRHMSGSPANGFPVRDLGCQHIFLHMSRKPEEERKDHEQNEGQTAVLKPDHDQNANYLAGVRKHADDT